MSAPEPSDPAVLVIGDVMTDVIVVPEGPLLPGTDRRATIRQHPGGSGANQAAWLASLGVPARFAGRVGVADRAAQMRIFAEAGVDARLAADPELPTGSVVTIVDGDGERSFFTDRGANLRLCGDDLPDALLDGIALLHVSGYALFEPGAREAATALLAEARQRGIPASVDPASESFLREAGPERFLGWTAGASVCFPNSAEAAVLAGSDDLPTQLEMLSRHYGAVVIKTGPFGAEAMSKGERCAVAAASGGAVDTSGAGDAFLAGFLAGLLSGDELRDCLQQAVTVAARAVARIGARPPPRQAALSNRPPA